MIKKMGALAMVSVLSIGMVACSGDNKDKPKEDNKVKTEQSNKKEDNTSTTDTKEKK
ncbi:hypothetical protein P4308_18590 [Bacillus wiedmannii]|uniref:hypothetical protein n=1 Tax=Bacillus wiedmannii TaxID=1890302 RepID=UPI002E1D6AD0|nr:hypothetical protein [Bacillus wiedmannii]